MPTGQSGATCKRRWTTPWLAGPSSAAFRNGSGITITNAAGGLFEIAIDAGDLTEVGDFAHQCQVTIGGVVSTVMEGTVRIKTDYVS